MPVLPAGLPNSTVATASVAESFARVPSAQVIRLEGISKIVPFRRTPAPVPPPLPDPIPVLARNAGIARIVAPAVVGGVLSAALTVQTELERGQSLQNSIAIGAADGVGTFAGQAIGGTLGSFAGPIGTVVGGTIGGLLGGLVARELARSLLPKIEPPIAEPIAAAQFATSNLAVSFGEVALCLDPGWLPGDPAYSVVSDRTGFVSTLRDTYFPDPAHPGHYRDNLGNTTFTQTPPNTFYVTAPGFRYLSNPPLNDAGTSAIVAAPPATEPDTRPAPATVPDTAPKPLDDPLREGKPVIVPFRTAPATPQTPTPEPQPEPEPTPAPEPAPEPTPTAPELPPSDPDPIFDPNPAPEPQAPPSEPKPQPEPQPNPAPIPQPASIPDPAPIPAPTPIPAPAPIPVPAQPQPNPQPATPPNPAPAPIPSPAEPASEPLKESPIFLPIEIPNSPDLAPISPPARPITTPQRPAPNPIEPDIKEWTPDNDPAILPGSVPMPGDALPLTIPPSTPAPAPAPAPLPIPSAPGYTPAPFSPLPIPAAPPPAPIAPITPAAAAVAPSPVMAGSAPSTPTTVVPSIPPGAKPIYQPNTAPGQIVPAPTPNGDPCKTNSSDLCQGQISDVVKGNTDKIEKLDLKAVANAAAIAGVTALLAATPIAIKKFIKCNGTEPIFGREPMTVPAFLVQAALANFDRLADIEGKLCEKCEAIATVPEHWQVRLESGRPQLVYVYQEVRSNGTFDNSWYQISVPHPKAYTKDNAPKLPNYQKGDWEYILTLTDNSKVIVNGKDEAACLAVIDAAKQIIDPSKLDTKIPIKSGKRSAVDGFAQRSVKLVQIHYYSKGARKGAKPDWRKRV